MERERKLPFLLARNLLVSAAGKLRDADARHHSLNLRLPGALMRHVGSHAQRMLNEAEICAPVVPVLY